MSPAHLRRAALCCAATLTILSSASAVEARTFTVRDEIEVAHFGDPYSGGAARDLAFSPDGRKLAVLIERGDLASNRVEDRILVYDVPAIQNFLASRADAAPEAAWTIKAHSEDGPVITEWRWLSDSSGIAYLERDENGARTLKLADARKKSMRRLSPPGRRVTAFDIRDVSHYAFTLADEGLVAKAREERKAVAVAGTGRRLFDLVFPVDVFPERSNWIDRSTLWAATGGKAREVSSNGRPVVLFWEGQRRLALSPDAKRVITVITRGDVPKRWEEAYPPPRPDASPRIKAGRQDLGTFLGRELIGQYVAIDLADGDTRELVDAPTTSLSGWIPGGRAARWSDDSRFALIPSTFTKAGPCLLAVVELAGDSSACLEPARARGVVDASYRSLSQTSFKRGDNSRVFAAYRHIDGSVIEVTYARRSDGAWNAESTLQKAHASAAAIDAAIRQGLNDRPVLFATDPRTGASRAILDPNKQLDGIDLGRADVVRWKDDTGHEWTAGLYKPPGFETGRRYPLVIQTHGFYTNQFRPSGMYPPFTARALAGAGIVVLQMPNCGVLQAPEEAPCNVAGFESAVRKLDADGIIDPARVALAGFSRTCYYTMEALVKRSLKLAAASISDGVMADYLQYMLYVNHFALGADAESVIGAAPFGEGLARWVERSPLFNIDKAQAPLLVVAHGVATLPFMWGPYAALARLAKPVDLIVLRDREHIPSNPATRLASQGTIVDWFRFWLLSEEDADPTKRDQYERWRKLKEAQRTSPTGG